MNSENQGETMSAKKKASGHTLLHDSRKTSSSSGFYTPFHDLKQRLIQPKSVQLPAKPVRPPNPALSAELTVFEDDPALFRKAMLDVMPLDQASRRRVPAPTPRRARPGGAVHEDEEVRAELLGLIRGESEFEISCSDEYIDGAVVGLSPRVLAKLRHGEFSCQTYVDLHGYNRVEARQVVTDFLRNSFAHNHRCVLVVSGRGHNSKNREPVLKEHLVTWLTRSPLNRLVLAFATARAHDGGAGAFYVLLRRSPGKAPFVSPTGW
jgi:DNA-nicking Smr family endonuclease